jgi:hypothetical protein
MIKWCGLGFVNFKAFEHCLQISSLKGMFGNDCENRLCEDELHNYNYQSLEGHAAMI